MNFKLIIKIDNYLFNTGLIQGAYIVGQVKIDSCIFYFIVLFVGF